MKAMALWLVLVVLATCAFYAALFAIYPLLSDILFRMPENYEYIARNHLERGEYDLALEACDREIQRYPYNFHAHFLQAQILREAGRTTDALALVWELPQKYTAVKRREDVPSRGWDEASLQIFLAEVLWEEKRYPEALDQIQLALDYRDPRIDARCQKLVEQVADAQTTQTAPWVHAARAILNPAYRLDRIPERNLFREGKPPVEFFMTLIPVALRHGQVDVARVLNFKQFVNHPNALPSLLAHKYFTQRYPPPARWRQPGSPKNLERREINAAAGRVTFHQELTSGAYRASSTLARFFRTSEAPGRARMWSPSRGAVIIARGEACDHMWPILTFRVNGRIVGRRYIRSSVHLAYTLPVALDKGTYEIAVGLDNDAVNPITGEDRNLWVREIRLY
jgi:tetratricopeptide (TPR) repeat protein